MKFEAYGRIEVEREPHTRSFSVLLSHFLAQSPPVALFFYLLGRALPGRALPGRAGRARNGI